MVLRKPAPAGGLLPYQITPTSPQPALEMASLQITHPDAFPSSYRRPSALDTQAAHERQNRDNGDGANLWADAADDELHIKKSLPTVLRAGSAPRSTEELQTDKGLSDLPHWGEGNTITPRSSSDSQRSMDLWDVDDYDNAETEALSKNESGRESRSLGIPDAIREHNGGQSRTSSSPGFSTVRRKPVAASSEYSQPSPGARSPPYDFAP